MALISFHCIDILKSGTDRQTQWVTLLDLERHAPLKTVVSKTNVNFLIKDIYNQTYQGPPDSFSFHSSSFYQICWQTVGIIIQVPLRSKVDNWIKKVASNWQFYREILVMIYCLKQNFLLILILIWCWIYALQISKIFHCDIV